MGESPRALIHPVRETRLNDAQQAASHAFARWLQAESATTPFVLTGYAGTGKTFLSMHLLQMVERQQQCWTTCAPTHKAVGVLNDYLHQQQLRPTWYPCTIHRLLHLKLKRVDGAEVCEETDQTAEALQNLDLVLVDEASMVDSQLLSISLRCAQLAGTRLVFVGDPAQLPPVKEPCSPVFAMADAQRAELTQVVRHSGPVLQLATALRSGTLPNGQPPVLPPFVEPAGAVGFVTRGDWLQRAEAALKAAMHLDHPDHARLLCFTNRSLERLVPMARRALHGGMADQLPVLPGEVLMSRKAVMAPACSQEVHNAEEPDIVLNANREMVVRDVQPEQCDLGNYGVSAAPVIATHLVTVETVEQELTLRLLPPLRSLPRHQLDNTLRELGQQARSAEPNQRKMLWRRFFLVRDSFAALGPAAVLTIHRSQGSTFGNVFIDADVFQTRDAVIRQQLLYVAVTRARESVWLVGNAHDHSAAPCCYQQQMVAGEVEDAAGNT